MGHKFLVLLRDELSGPHLRQTVVQGMLYYGLLSVCLSILGQGSLESPAVEIQTLLLITVFNFILLSTLIPSYFESDFVEGYLGWFRGSDDHLRLYFLAKMIAGIVLFIYPILLLSLIGIRLSVEGIPVIPFLLSTSLMLLTALCWGGLFQILMGAGGAGSGANFQTSLLSLLLLPLMIPTFLVGWECINTLVRGDYWGYYLGMQGGLFLASLAMGLGLTPLAIRHMEG